MLLSELNADAYEKKKEFWRVFMFWAINAQLSKGVKNEAQLYGNVGRVMVIYK